ncbi:MAG: LysR family transcriptional regulator [Rhodospirillales bacterium]|nr:LysR family transcriptional regulator [Rhodospirillales bacterium]
MSQDLDAMALFARVVETGSFTGAAAQLGLSKSSASKQVGRLEARLGARLLNRTTRRLALTEAGQAFFEGCQRVVAEAAAAEQAVTQLAAAPRGVLRVNAPMSFGVLHVAPALPALLAACPELALDLTLNDRRVDLIEEGYDMAIRIGALGDSSLIARRLAPSHRVLCAAPSYLDQHGRPQAPEDLAKHDCLVYSYQSLGREWRLASSGGGPGGGPDGERRVKIAGRLAVNNGDALLSAAVGGFGINFLPSFIAGEALRSGRLERLLPGWRDAEQSGVYAVYPAGRNLAPKVRVFIDFLAARFGDTPYWDRGLDL